MSPNPWKQRLLTLAPWCAVTAIALLFALSYGFNYGIDNHPVYLLQALRLLKPEILQHDWYAADAMQYHPVFSYIGAPLMRLSPKGWGIGLALTVCITLGTASWYAPLRRLVRSPWLAVSGFAAVVALMHATQTLSIAVSYVFNQAFQPSTLGSVGLLLALGPFVAGRWLWSGIFLAFSGLFHANYLVLNVAVFGLVHLLLGGDWRALLRRLLLQLGPSLLPLALLAGPMLSTVSADNAVEAQRLLFQIRAPHHYVPRSFERDLILPLGWLALGLASSAALPRSRALRLLRLWMIACSVVIWVPTLLTSWSYVPRIAQLFVWRMAPYLDVAGQSLFCLAAVRCAWTGRAWRSLTPAQWGVCVTSALALASAYGLRGERPVTVVLLGLLGVAVLGALGSQRISWRPRLVAPVLRWTAAAVTLLLTCWFTWPEVAQIRARSNLLTGFPQPERELFDWARANTDVEARFLTPPQEPSFRYFAERAIVVDWKSTPMLPADVLEWYARMKAVTGRPNFASFRDMDGYRDINVTRVNTLRAKYAFDYVVTYGVASGLERFKLAYRNPRFSVYDVR